jgi:hypothetical protein
LSHILGREVGRGRIFLLEEGDHLLLEGVEGGRQPTGGFHRPSRGQPYGPGGWGAGPRASTSYPVLSRVQYCGCCWGGL